MIEQRKRTSVGRSRTLDRRLFLTTLTTGLVACQRKAERPSAAPLPRRLVQFPGKERLYLLTDRPPQLETPISHFRHDITPNEAFFVRWHLADMPKSVDMETFRLRVRGHVQRELAFSLHDLRTRFAPISYVALSQCSGNSRGLFTPRVPGGQWGHGAMGNAQWTGVRLRDLLDAAGVRAGAVEVSFDGLDKGTQQSVPDYVKSLSIDHARDEDVMVAYEMNGAPLPLLNGFPLRLVVPGWYATYWVKALETIEVLKMPFAGFWMSKAYKIPNNPTGSELPEQLATDVVPINRICIHSIFVRPDDGEALVAGKPYPVEGLATDGGGNIRRVEVSTDGGKQWSLAQLDKSLGRYSWRRWRFPWTPPRPGIYRLQVRAENAAGEKQRSDHWSRSGYMRQNIEEVIVHVT
jgi:sulfite dehydrogenase